jgi:hypothetical protein
MLNYVVSIFLFIDPLWAHLFMGNPPTFRWGVEIDKLIMPLNGDENHQGLGWGQQPFPCKGFHRDSPQTNSQVQWKAGELVTIQLVQPAQTG